MPVESAQAISAAARALVQACLADARAHGIPAVREIDPLHIAFPVPRDVPLDMMQQLRRLGGL